MDPITTPPLFDVTRINTVIAAVASGIVGTCFGHPLDLIKVRLQALSNTNQYNGSWDCLKQTLKNDGMPGLFRGIAPPLVGSTILNVISFSSYTLLNDLQLDYKRRHRDSTETGPPKLQNYNYALSGLGVGIFCAPAVCPIEVVKVRMQLDRKEVAKGLVNNTENAPQRYKGSWDCFNKVLKTEGVKGLYTGFSYTTARDLSYSTTYFFVYEPLKQFLASKLYTSKRLKSEDPENYKHEGFPLLPVILSGGTSGALAWTVALPFDCVKTLIQKPTDEKKKMTSWGVVRAQYAFGGVKAFYSGWIPTILRAFAVSGVRFLVYESTSHFLNKLWKKKVT